MLTPIKAAISRRESRPSSGTRAISVAPSTGPAPGRLVIRSCSGLRVVDRPSRSAPILRCAPKLHELLDAQEFLVASLPRPRDSMWGPTFPELVEVMPGIEIIDRSSVNAFDDVRVARAIEATGRKKLIFAGISLEVCAAFPAITAVGKGLDAYVAVDASGTFSETKRKVGLLRMLQAGVILSDYATLMVEILRDNARLEAGEVYGAMDMGWAKLVGQIAQAYGK